MRQFYNVSVLPCFGHGVPLWMGGGEDGNVASLCGPHHRGKPWREARARSLYRSSGREPEKHPGLLGLRPDVRRTTLAADRVVAHG